MLAHQRLTRNDLYINPAGPLMRHLLLGKDDGQEKNSCARCEADLVRTNKTGGSGSGVNERSAFFKQALSLGIPEDISLGRVNDGQTRKSRQQRRTLSTLTR